MTKLEKVLGGALVLAVGYHVVKMVKIYRACEGVKGETDHLKELADEMSQVLMHSECKEGEEA